MIEIILGTTVVLSMYKIWGYYKERSQIEAYAKLMDELKQSDKFTKSQNL